MPVNSPSRKLTDLLMVGGLALYFATFTLPFNKGLANLGMHIAFIGFIGAYFNHPNKALVLRFVVKPWILLFSFFILVFLGPRISSPDILLSAKNFFTDFDDVFFVAPALLFLIQSIEKQRNILILFLLAGLSLAVTIGATISLNWSSLHAHALREYGDAIVVLWPFALFTLITPSTGFGRLNQTFRVFALVILIFFITALAVGASRGAWIAILFSSVGLVFLIFLTREPRRVSQLLTLLIVLVLLAFVGKSTMLRAGDSGRWNLVWKPALTLVQQNPYIGFGYDRKMFGTFQEQLQASSVGTQIGFRASPFRDFGPHNIFLQIAFFSGWPSAMAFAISVFSGFARLLSRTAALSYGGFVFVGVLSGFSYFIVRGAVEELNFIFLSVFAPFWILVWRTSKHRLDGNT